MLYMVTLTINIPQMLAYIPAPWIRHGIGNLQRIRQAALMFARGVPIIYYGTEQGLDGHQANVLESPGWDRGHHSPNKNG